MRVEASDRNAASLCSPSRSDGARGQGSRPPVTASHYPARASHGSRQRDTVRNEWRYRYWRAVWRQEIPRTSCSRDRIRYWPRACLNRKLDHNKARKRQDHGDHGPGTNGNAHRRPRKWLKLRDKIERSERVLKRERRSGRQPRGHPCICAKGVCQEEVRICAKKAEESGGQGRINSRGVTLDVLQE